MPFASDKERAFLYAKHPELAKRWRKEAGPQKNLPKYAKKGNKALKGLKNAHK